MPEPIAYLKGEFVPASECRLHIYDLGVVLGAAVTDFLRTFRQRPYRLEAHVARFHASMRYARIASPLEPEESMDVTRKLIAHNAALAPGEELGLVYYCTAGENALYAGAAGMPAKLEPTYVQHTFPLRFHLWRGLFLEGAHCVTPSVRHWPPESLTSKIKHRNRLHMWIGEQEAHLADPRAVALFQDIHGNISETGGANIVVYREGRVISPRRSNILWGVSLTVLTEILRSKGIPFAEDDLQVVDLVTADEVWLVTTPYCMAPVVKVNGASIGDGKPGKMWRTLLDAWSESVGKDVYREMADSRE